MLYVKTFVRRFMIRIYRIFLRMRNVSDRICRDNRNTCVMCKKFFLRKSCFLRDDVEKYDTARHATDENTVQKICDLHAE